MREILFRGKRKVNDEWVQGFLFVSRKGECKIKWYDPEYGSAKTSEVYPETVGQYTGLTDKNGKKIFEGDVVVSYDLRGRKNGCGIVNWNELFVSWHIGEISMYGGNLGVYEVIGNIHDNPELLGGADNG